MTNQKLIPKLAMPNQSLQQREPLIQEFLKDDEIFQQLDDGGKRAVIQGIQEELQKLDRNKGLSDLQIEDYMQWTLRERVPLWLAEQLAGQRMNESMAAKRRARFSPHELTREDKGGSRSL